MPHPDVAVVIPTARRETRLAFALEALADQTLPSERFEVIVVRAADSGAKTEPPAGLEVRFVEAPAASGPAEKRNTGWRAATAPFVVFTDDDCRPAPAWLERLLDVLAVEYEKDPALVLQGRTEPDPDELGRLHGLARSQLISEPSEWFQTCNIGYPRELLERLGGFDEAYEGAGEDTDLGVRAVAEGARLVYADEALTWHAVHSRHVWHALRDTSRWHTVPLLYARHPQLRSSLELGIFWRARHWRVLLALAGVGLLARGRPLTGALALAPYLRRHRESYAPGLRGLARAGADLPAHALVDAVEVVETGRAGIRHRVPVL